MAAVSLGPNSASIDTERLHIRSVTPDDLDSYVKLYGDPDVMKSFADGKTKTKAEVEPRLALWCSRWKEGDPFSALAVETRDKAEFIGHIILGHGENPGESEMAYLFVKDAWGRKFGTEAVQAVTTDYVDAIRSREFLLNRFHLDRKPLTTLCATARVDNVASNRILEGIGMWPKKTDEKYGAQRHHYTLDVNYARRNPVITVEGKRTRFPELSARQILGLVEKPKQEKS